ncbi:MAG: Metal-dependent membrane protease, CAAX family, DUF2324 subfamily [Candidatus Methanohalarchaeum thermophilum]|uniref:Metal-dependent membrane protease, CAAX family, DUF2324 subfamily n=1 Tax=Methanohalarchaeum thermophilum TaxID=1903181 RepID=A0A1Q6DS85_METT1|nr:MAG: Metal-dependent membrane protease, CAAX family, DUF2324 subfamily [Candidatus Methanohalarchaeum thermophilum]
MRFIDKKLIILVLLVLFSSFLVSGVVAQKPYDEVTDSFLQGLDDNDYSAFEAYLSDQMVEAFDEDGFTSFRQNLVSKYGEPIDYEFDREEEIQGTYIGAYYDYEFEDADLTIRVVLSNTTEGYQISGLQVTDVDVKDGATGFIGKLGSNLLNIVFPALGGIFGLLAFYFLGFKKMRVKEIGLGVLLLVVTLVVQPVIQNSVFMLMGINSNAGILARGGVFVVAASLWIGFVAGGFQQSIRYPFAKKRSIEAAAFIGIGFGLAEAVGIPLISIFAAQTPTTVFSLNWNLLGLYERFIITLFHGCSTAIMAYAYKNGWGLKSLGVLIFLHGFIDTFAGYYQLKGSMVILASIYVVTTVISLSLLVFIKSRFKNFEDSE